MNTMAKTFGKMVFKNKLLLAAGAIFVFSIIFREQPYIMYLLSLILLYAIASYGLDVMVGWTGALMFCPGSLAVLGGYTSALLVMEAGVPFGVTLLISMLLSGIVSVLVVSAVMLLDEPVDILLVTFAFEEITFHILQSWRWAGGSMGIRDIPYISIFGLSLEKPFETFLFIGIVLVIVWLMLSWLYKSRHGKRLRAIRYDPQLLESLGRSVTRGRIVAFFLGGCILGLFGAIYGALFHTLAPAGFTFGTMTLTIFFIIILGGMGTMAGPALGAAFWVILPEIFAFVPKQKSLIIAVILIVVIMVLPQGIASVFNKFEKGK